MGRGNIFKVLVFFFFFYQLSVKFFFSIGNSLRTRKKDKIGLNNSLLRKNIA